ncbi:MAG TPA: hypothetical protein VFV34_18505, partial [Blastocatellia bacterium]|nr:hypothetical protein [Blastocatellia bacterium]
MKAKAVLILLVTAAILAVVSASALPSARIKGRQNHTSGKNSQKKVDRSVSQITLADADDDDDDDDDEEAQEETCTGPAVRLPSTKLFIEHNSTDEDTGVHGLFDGANWVKLLIFDPRGRLVFEVEPNGQLKTQSISGIFFESAEPPNEEVPIEE